MSVYLILGIAAAVLGLVIGRVAAVSVRRGAAGPAQAASRQHRLLLVFVAVLALTTTIDAVTTPRHRVLDTAVLVLMAAGVAFDWIRARRAKIG